MAATRVVAMEGTEVLVVAMPGEVVTAMAQVRAAMAAEVKANVATLLPEKRRKEATAMATVATMLVATMAAMVEAATVRVVREREEKGTRVEAAR